MFLQGKIYLEMDHTLELCFDFTVAVWTNCLGWNPAKDWNVEDEDEARQIGIEDDRCRDGIRRENFIWLPTSLPVETNRKVWMETISMGKSLSYILYISIISCLCLKLIVLLFIVLLFSIDTNRLSNEKSTKQLPLIQLNQRLNWIWDKLLGPGQ